MELKIKINDKATLLLDVKEEMSLGEFVAMSSIVTKIDKYSFNIKKEVKGIRSEKPNRKPREQLSKKQKKSIVDEWEKSSIEQRTKMAEKMGLPRINLAYKVGYFRKCLAGVKK
jgi:hypothetical protein